MFGLRVLWAPLLFGFILPGNAPATPIEPDVKELLQQADREPAKYIPARAGWYGPESARRSPLPVNPDLEAIKPERTLARHRGMLVALAMPDWVTWSLIGFSIVLLRVLRTSRVRKEVRHDAIVMPGTHVPGRNEVRAA